VSGVWTIPIVALASVRLALKSSANAPTVSAAPIGVSAGMS
jgi:hypothetical protein